MGHYDDLFEAAQARQITNLRIENDRLKKENAILADRNAKDHQPAIFYRQLQAAILENPILQSEWDRFCSFLKLASAEFNREETPPEDDDSYFIPVIGD
jgi:hypothetical protein